MRFDTTHGTTARTNMHTSRQFGWKNEEIKILNQPHMKFSAPKSDEEIRLLTMRDTKQIDLATIQDKDWPGMLRDEKKYQFLGNKGIKLTPHLTIQRVHEKLRYSSNNVIEDFDVPLIQKSLTCNGSPGYNSRNNIPKRETMTAFETLTGQISTR